jgi:hypothetical protein
LLYHFRQRCGSYRISGHGKGERTLDLDTLFCVTVNGNIPQFSVAGGEMIAVGNDMEGYGVCDVSANVGYYDYALFDSGNWGSSTLTHSGNVVTVTRSTSDDIWQLTQKITNVTANATGPGSAKVSMALKNLSSISRAAYILRFADVNAPATFRATILTSLGQPPMGWSRRIAA